MNDLSHIAKMDSCQIPDKFASELNCPNYTIKLIQEEITKLREQEIIIPFPE